MKLSVYIISLLWVINLCAQLKTTVEIKSLSGYESNIFKSPNSLINSAGNLLGKDSLYKSSFYQSADFKFVATKKWKKQRLSFRINPRGQFYYTENDASFFTIYSGLKYEKNLSNKKKLQITSRYNFRNRDGDNVDGSELNFPLGYGHFDISTGLHFRWYKQNRTFVKAIYGNRNYKKSPTNKLSYNSIGISTVFRNVFKRKAGYHSYGIEASFVNKYFQQVNDVAQSSKEFKWKDIEAGMFYRYPITKRVQIKPSLMFKKRRDSDNDKFTYTQIKPSINFKYKHKGVDVDFIGTYINRKYKTLLATDSNWIELGKLTYSYYQLKFEAKKQLNKKLSILAKCYINNRVSNKTNENAIYFRDYNYFYGGIGLKYIL